MTAKEIFELRKQGRKVEACELQKCITTRKAQGFGVTKEMQEMLQQLAGVQPVTDAEQQAFYSKIVEKFC